MVKVLGRPASQLPPRKPTSLAGSANSTPQSENSASANDASLQIDSPVAALRKTWPVL